MRRSAPNFKVEVRRSARRTHRVGTFDSDTIDPPSADDVPSQDVHTYDAQSIDDQMRQAEAALFGYEYRPIRVPPKLPHSRGYHADTELPAPQVSEQAAETVAEAPKPQGRILQSTTYVDPLEQRLQEHEEEKKARRRGRPPKDASVPTSTQPRKRASTEWPDDVAIATRASETKPVEIPVAPTAAQPVIAHSVTSLRLKPSTRTRQPDQRILYNAWTYRVVKTKAHRESEAIAESLLRPGERWKRRLPTHAW